MQPGIKVNHVSKRGPWIALWYQIEAKSFIAFNPTKWIYFRAKSGIRSLLRGTCKIDKQKLLHQSQNIAKLWEYFYKMVCMRTYLLIDVLLLHFLYFLTPGERLWSHLFVSTNNYVKTSLFVALIWPNNFINCTTKLLLGRHGNIIRQECMVN